MAARDSGTVSVEEYEKLAKDYRELLEEHQRLKDRHASCEPFIKEARGKYHAAKENAMQWSSYLVKNGFLPKRSKLNPEDDTTPKAAPPQLEEQHATSSQSTEIAPEDSRVEIKEAPSSDEPEFVSSRSLKRARRESSKQMRPPVHIKVEPTSQSDSIEIRSDDYSSPAPKRQKSYCTEVSDLDESVVHMDTPRKGNRRTATSEEVPRAPNLLLESSSLSEGAIAGGNDDRAVHKKMGANEKNDGASGGDSELPTSDGSTPTNVLRQRSVNIPTPPKPLEPRANVKRKRRLEIGILSEDGYGQRPVREGESDPAQPLSSQERRLDTLLEAPTPDRQVLPKRPTPEPKISKQAKKPSPAEAQPTPPTNPRPEPATATFQIPRGLKESLPPVKSKPAPPKQESLPPPKPKPPPPKQNPLRSLPLEKLHPDDFKINPAYLNSTFAFTETFRGRDHRRTLGVCTCPDCTGGAFKTAIEMGVATSGKTDHEALAAYLGPDFAKIITGYGKEKRKDVLIDAHAHAFAAKHGKHRQAFERRSTPPGYWRIDMPSTQEEEQDRERARVLERQKTEHRWLEALRGGRWMFRDE